MRVNAEGERTVEDDGRQLGGVGMERRAAGGASVVELWEICYWSERAFPDMSLESWRENVEMMAYWIDVGCRAARRCDGLGW